MISISKKIKKAFFGIALGIMVIGGSAYAFAGGDSKLENKPAKFRAITSDFLVNKGSSGYQQRATFTPTGCNTLNPNLCGYTVTPAGKTNIPDQPSYTPAEIASYVSNNWLVPAPGSGNALYAL